MRRSAILFPLMALAQLAVPAWMIIGHERILREGQVFKFRTAPIDPRDPFRGEYVRLNFEVEQGTYKDPSPPTEDSTAVYSTDRTAFAHLAVSDSSGYAVITGLSVDPPAQGAYIRIEYWNYGQQDGSVSGIRLPFDRYYLEEGDGARTEQMLRPQWNDGNAVQELMPAYALVRVYDGEPVIEDLIVGGKPIHEWLDAP